MTHQSCFDTVNTEGAAKRRAREERKRLDYLNAAQKRQRATEVMLRDLQRTVAMLEESIKAELESVWIKTPSHFAFPMNARELVARRDNLKATIAALTDQ